MRLSSVVVVALATQALGDWFGGKAAYNKWHETELERWLSDHDIPHPKAADRKDLEDLVKNNWDDYVSKPYNKWDSQQLSGYLSSQGHEIKKGTEKNKDSLLQQVSSYWHETADQSNEAYHNVQNWIFDTWTDSQIKSFLDYHGIPNPTPRTRDSLLSTARSNYQSVANKAGETVNYPGNWLYQSWSDSDMKAWLDERGIPAPQPSSRDKLIASLRRNARIASNNAASSYASASASAHGAQQSLTDQLLDSWSDSQLKEWFDKQGIKVPQGSKRNEMVALARKHSAGLTGNNVSGSAASAYGAATSSAGNYYAQATGGLYAQGRHYYDAFLNNFGLASAQAKSSLSSASASASSAASVAASQTSGGARSSVSSGSSRASASLSSKSSSGSSRASASASSASSSASSAASRASKSASSAASSASSKASKKKDEL